VERIFVEAQSLLEDYVEARGFIDPSLSADREVIIEARTRLQQLEYLAGKVHELEQVLMDLDRAHQLPMLILLYTEAFYYMAARLESVFQKSKNFGRRGYPSTKVSVIRYLIIEHPEAHFGHPMVSFSWRHDDGRGPVLEGRSSDGKVVDDPGLFRNADEFRRQVEEMLRKAIERVTPSGMSGR
jgi:hypothetical protein